MQWQAALVVRKSIAQHQLPALHALAFEPGHSAAQEANLRYMLLISKDFDLCSHVASLIAT
jgi:hypothetical protein